MTTLGLPNSTGIINVQGEEQALVFLPQDEGGLVSIVSLNIPAGEQSEGTPTDVSAYVGRKTFEISGTYTGSYTILGSHDGVNYAPLVTFSNGQVGQQEFQKVIPFITRFVKVRRRADAAASITMAAQMTCPCP